MIKAVALLSGGKDSVFATYIAQQQPFEIISTLTAIPASGESMMLHVPNARLARVVSSAMGLPNHTVEVDAGEDETSLIARCAKQLGADAVITGALASDYQSQKINMKCEPLGLRVFSPLWHKNQESILREIVRAGFEVIVVSVSAEGLDDSWLGRKIDEQAIDRLKKISERYGIQIAGEGGEYETFVLDGPEFEKRLEIVSCRRSWRRDSGILQIDALRLLKKDTI